MRYFIGIDVGGTKIEGIIMNEDKKILDKIRISTDADKGKNAVIENIVKLAQKLWIDPVYGVGIGVPGPVSEEGVVLDTPNIPKFKSVNLKKILSKKLGVEVRIENDANLFALAEHVFGAGKKYPNMLGVIIGTGVGSGLILNNMLFSGRHGGAGEIGHNIIDKKKNKDLEYFCSGPGIIRLYRSAGGKANIKTTLEVFNLNDPIAHAVIEKTHELLSEEFSRVVNLLNVELIVIGGGVSNSLDLKKLNKLTKESVFGPIQKTFKIVRFNVGDSSGSLGAASLYL